ncbi:hypothetical protein POM88_008949 [Heracleum sosnowskyi]|uniref:RNase H type-1 domain-containing protein n=1 Tax=Heracleum sosnowskyi TaxID=360622 RepID=A0AAD8JAH4_9APIA|nr:hypothetical protein POM88_008949 [Heracleum sosnowskyi]
MEAGNVNVNPRWRMPPKGVIKINVHAFFTDQPLENGNHSGIGVVCRNSKGDIVSMLSGSLGFDNRRENEYNAFMEGLKQAYYRDYTDIVLETDHVEAYWIWRHSSLEGAPEPQAPIVQQLNQRRQDENYRSKVFLTDFEDNALAVYLAEYGAQNFKEMVVMENPFGRVQELWSLDMGLGPIGPRFQARRLEEVVHNAAVEDVLDPDNHENDVHEGADEENQVPMAEDGDGHGLHPLAAALVGMDGDQ